jgi:hypothetical protein
VGHLFLPKHDATDQSLVHPNKRYSPNVREEDFSEVQCSNPRPHSPGLGRMRPPPKSAPPLLTATTPRGPQT